MNRHEVLIAIDRWQKDPTANVTEAADLLSACAKLLTEKIEADGPDMIEDVRQLLEPQIVTKLRGRIELAPAVRQVSLGVHIARPESSTPKVYVDVRFEIGALPS